MGIMLNMLVRVIFSGVVQGVRGTVRNLRDGAVEVYAEGSKDQVEALISVLRVRDGVERVEVEKLDGFEIVF